MQKNNAMTGEEKRKILKEQYKKELQLRKEYLEKVERLRKLKNVTGALTSMEGALNDDSEDWIGKIDQETAIMEAKTEMALDSQAAVEQQIQQLEQEGQMEKITAKDLVEQMKREMGLLPEVEEGPEAPEAKEGEENTPKEDSPRKTMGDF